MENAKEAIEEFEKEYQRDMEDVAQQEREETMFKRRELPGKFKQRCYMDGRTDDTTRNIGVGWREIRDDRRAGNP